jgi:predicted DNA-binding transcriptional regulator AlpA
VPTQSQSQTDVAAPATITVLRRSQVCKALGVSTWTLERWLRAGQFPKPIFLTPTSNVGVWYLRDLDAFLTKRKRARRVKPSARGMFKQRRTRRARAGGEGAS